MGETFLWAFLAFGAAWRAAVSNVLVTGTFTPLMEGFSGVRNCCTAVDFCKG